MELKEILHRVDHTLLAQTASWEEVKALCEDALKYETASVCIPASYVKQVKEYVKDRMAFCTVIGFPNGYSTTAAKVFFYNSFAIFTIRLVPNRSAPSSRKRSASAREEIPPAALIFTPSPT